MPDTIQLVMRNTLGIPVKAVPSLDDANLPPGWSVSMSPAAGDSVTLGTGSWMPIEVILTGVGGGATEGIVDIAMELNTDDARACETCDDSLCGGYIGLAGGCSIKLVVEGTVPVFFSEIVAEPFGDAIAIRWRTANGGEDASFNVYRSEKGTQEFVRLNEVPIAGGGWLSYLDRTAERGIAYFYRVGAVVNDSEVFSREVAVTLEHALELNLDQNYPNPFNPVTTISFVLNERTQARLSIYDTEGKLVTTLVNDELGPGLKVVTWDGKDDRGHQVSSGVYLCRLTAGKRTLTKKMVLIK